MSIGDGEYNNLAVRESEYTNRFSEPEQREMSFVDDLYSVGARINIYSCNAGHLDHKDDNLAQEFAKITTGMVYASDGSVSYYNGLYGTSLFGVYEPRLSNNQEHFYDQCTEPREPTGFNFWN